VLKRVTIAHDRGRDVEIASGLTAVDRVIENPPDGLEAGDDVRIASGSGTATAANAETVKR
jgi:hypothetical protein